MKGVRRIRSRSRLDDGALTTTQKKKLRDLAAVAVSRRAGASGARSALRTRRPPAAVVALFTGASSSAKTAAATAFANEIDLPLYRIDLAHLVSKYIGETEKNLSRAFDSAESSGTVLLIDEADALLGKRTEVKDAHDRYANVEVDYLLQRIEKHPGVVILATNRKGDLDQAFTRRLRYEVRFRKPPRE